MTLHGRKTMVATMKRLSNAAGVLQIAGNKQRCAIIISSPVGRTTIVQWGAADDVATGPPIPPQAGPLVLTESMVGSAITEPFTLIDSAAAQQTFGWIEVQYAP